MKVLVGVALGMIGMGIIVALGVATQDGRDNDKE